MWYPQNFKHRGTVGAAIFAFLCLFLGAFPAFTSVSVASGPSGFLANYSKLSEGKDFRMEYIAAGADFAKYQKVRINPVEIKYFKERYREFAPEEIEYLSASLKKNLEEMLGAHYQIANPREWPDEKTLVINPALVTGNSPKLSGFKISQGSVAFEAQLLDGGTGKEIAAVAEKRKGGWADYKSLFWGDFFRFAHADEVFKKWGKNFVKMTSDKPRELS